MSRQTIYDRNYETLGYIEEDDRRATAYDRNWNTLGYYENGRTYDRNWETIAEGNVLSALIYNAR